jgi:hypothetical protein
VLDDEEGVAVLAVEPLDLARQLAQQRAVDAGAELVQQHHLGPDHHGAAELQQLLLPAREVPRILALEVSQAQLRQHLARPRSQRPLLAHHLAPGEPGAEQVLARLLRRHHHQVLDHRHAREFLRDLEGAPEAAVEQAMRRPAR